MQLKVQPSYRFNTIGLKKNHLQSNRNSVTNPIHTSQVSFQGDKFDYQSHYEDNLKGLSGIGKKRRAKKLTNAQQIGYYEAQSEKDELWAMNQQLTEKLLEEKKNEIKDLKEGFNSINEQLKKASENNQKTADLQKEYEN